VRRERRLAAIVEVILASGFPTQFGIGALLMLAGVRPWDAENRLSLGYMVTLLVFDTALVLALIAVMLRARGERPAQVFLGLRRPGREAGLGLALTPVIFGGTAVVLVALRWAWPWLHNVATNPFESVIQTPADAVILGAAAVLGGGLKEELQRAFILRRFDQHLGGAWVGLVLYSLVFGAGHVMQGWDIGIMTALLGLAWGMIYLWRRSTVAPIVSHCGFNAAQIVQFLVFGS
jgi:membrane protease YdiL (CAAX protease family)